MPKAGLLVIEAGHTSCPCPPPWPWVRNCLAGHREHSTLYSLTQDVSPQLRLCIYDDGLPIHVPHQGQQHAPWICQICQRHGPLASRRHRRSLQGTAFHNSSLTNAPLPSVGSHPSGKLSPVTRPIPLALAISYSIMSALVFNGCSRDAQSGLELCVLRLALSQRRPFRAVILPLFDHR